MIARRACRRLRETATVPGVRAKDDRRASRHGESQLKAHVDVALLHLAGFELLLTSFDLGLVRCQGGVDPRGKAPDLVLRARTAVEVPAVGLGVVEETAATDQCAAPRAPFVVAARQGEKRPVPWNIAGSSFRSRIESTADEGTSFINSCLQPTPAPAEKLRALPPAQTGTAATISR